MNRGVVIFIEGETEAEFFNRIINQLHSYAPGGRFQVDKLIIKNLKGIGNYKTKAKRVFEQNILAKNPRVNFSVILCYDTDAFDFSPKPPVNWKDVERNLKNLGAKKVIHIKATRSIEDWFLLDQNGVLRYLRLSKSIPIPNSRGAERIKFLFKKANKVYIKGPASKSLVDTLDIKLIMSSICKELSKLCKELGIECDGKKCD